MKRFATRVFGKLPEQKYLEQSETIVYYYVLRLCMHIQIFKKKEMYVVLSVSCLQSGVRLSRSNLRLQADKSQMTAQ